MTDSAAALKAWSNASGGIDRGGCDVGSEVLSDLIDSIVMIGWEVMLCPWEAGVRRALTPNLSEKASRCGVVCYEIDKPNYKDLKLQGENCMKNCQNEVNLGFLEGNSARGVVVAVFLLFSISSGIPLAGKSCGKESTSHSLAGGVRLSYGLGAISSARENPLAASSPAFLSLALQLVQSHHRDHQISTIPSAYHRASWRPSEHPLCPF